jgi:tetratricopeptide (TPR) repeat protein
VGVYLVNKRGASDNLILILVVVIFVFAAFASIGGGPLGFIAVIIGIIAVAWTLVRIHYPIAYYTFVIKLIPSYTTAYWHRGESYRGRGEWLHTVDDFDRAFADLTHAIERKPTFAAAYNGRGVIYMHRKDYERAIKEFDCVQELTPKFAPSYQNRGLCRFHLGDYNQALADCNWAIELSIYNPGDTIFAP